MGTANRVQKLRQQLASLDLGAILITNSYNRYYLTGFTGTSGYVLVTHDRAFFLTDFRYVTQASQQAQGFEIVEHKANPMETVRELLQGLGIAELGFEQMDVTYGQHAEYAKTLEGIRLVPTNSVVERLRMYKDEEELAIIQEAADLADKTFQHILGFLKPGVSERDVALEMEFYMRANKAASSSFDTIVASGVRSAMPHGVASDKVLETGDFVTLDFGALYNRYCSDLTRTVVLGTPTEKQRDIYNIVLEAQQYCLDHLKPGMTGREGDALARKIIAQYGYGDYFGHGTGHSFGLEIHEAPRLSPTCDVVLEPGMTMTVEPGIYLPEFGGVRIEDDIVITETGVKVLTRSPKELLRI